MSHIISVVTDETFITLGFLRIITDYYGHKTAMQQTIIPGITIHIWLVNPSEKY